jgi:hypothetical protein
MGSQTSSKWHYYTVRERKLYRTVTGAACGCPYNRQSVSTHLFDHMRFAGRVEGGRGPTVLLEYAGDYGARGQPSGGGTAT